MFKTILLSVLGAILVVALAASAYYTMIHSESALAAPDSNTSQTDFSSDKATVPQTSASSAAAFAPHPFNPDNALAQGNGNGNRYGRAGGNQPAGQNTSNPQADLSQAVTVQGVVVRYEYGTLTLQTEIGELVAIQLGNQNYLRQINFVPVTGETLSVVAFLGEQGLLTAVTVTRLSDGSVYSLRNSTLGRPLWAGGRSRQGDRQP